MKKRIAMLSCALVVLVGVLSGCGATPEPTAPPPTQTPWIIVVTATSDPDSVAQVLPSQTPWIVVATPTGTARPKATRTTKPTATPTKARSSPTPSATPSATPSLTPGLEPSVVPVQTETPPPPTLTPTNTPLPGSITYPAPELLEPPEEQRIGWRGEVLLKWTSVGALAEDEYYNLHLDRPAVREGLEPYGDYLYTKDTSYLVPATFLDPFHPPAVQGDTPVFWWVRVVRKTGEAASGKPIGVDIGSPSEKRILILEAKPEDA